jgi:hypothetical protein
MNDPSGTTWFAVLLCAYPRPRAFLVKRFNRSYTGSGALFNFFSKKLTRAETNAWSADSLTVFHRHNRFLFYR